MARRRSSVVVSIGALVLVTGAAVFVAVRDRLAHPPDPSLPTISLGGSTRDEACLLCHAGMQGLGEPHASMGCSPCHLGDPRARDASAAHLGMEVLSGDLASVDRTCGQGACHAVETARVRTSLMARAPGILAVDRFAFGERATPEGEPSDDLGALEPTRGAASPAESHVRQLCASCHLGARKARRGDLGAEARGGGCTACHLAPPAPRRGAAAGPLHPDVSAAVSERRCEGCHARSGRIALSFRGVVELEPGDARVTGKLADGRPIGAASADVHATAGMRCLDCHTERELMGDGVTHRHAHEARDVTCEDCHLAAASAARDAGRGAARDADREAVASRLRASWTRRGLPPLSRTPLRTKAGTPLWRTELAPPSLLLAASGERRAIPQASPKPYHALRGHERLDCQSCHATWAPRCTSCHTRLEPKEQAIDHLSGKPVMGRWSEVAGGNGYGPPLLAVGPTGRIEPFVEGMRLRIEGAGPARTGSTDSIERTLFAPLDPHTTGKARACASCHAPARTEDVYPLAGETTRTSARLLDAAERGRVLRVGRCIGCHARYEDPVFADFAESARRVAARTAPRCTGTLE